MSIETNLLWELVDADQRPLGEMRIVQLEASLFVGTFQRGPEFSRVSQLFHEFEVAAEAQALHAIESLDAAIAALGLQLRDPVTGATHPAIDVQIWSDGSMTCRLGEMPPQAVPAIRYSSLSNLPIVPSVT